MGVEFSLPRHHTRVRGKVKLPTGTRCHWLFIVEAIECERHLSSTFSRTLRAQQASGPRAKGTTRLASETLLLVGLAGCSEGLLGMRLLVRTCTVRYVLPVQLLSMLSVYSTVR